jgi:hypothetical protein
MLLGHIYVKMNDMYNGGLLFILQHFLFSFISTVTQWGGGVLPEKMGTAA